MGDWDADWDCGLGEGDCDANNDCKNGQSPGGLRCGDSNCRYHAYPSADGDNEEVYINAKGVKTYIKKNDIGNGRNNDQTLHMFIDENILIYRMLP